MRERNRSPAAVELQQISNLVVNRNHLLDKPPSKQILDRIQRNLYDTKDPKVQQYQPIAQPFAGYISPENPYLLLWDLTVMVAIYIFFFEMGFLIAFTAQFWINLKHYSYTIGLYTTLLAVFVLDIGVNFHKGFYHFGKGHIIIEKEKIVKRYLKSMFIIDMLSLVCVVLPLFTSSAWNLIQLLFLLKYRKKQSYQIEIKRGLEKYPNVSIVFSLLFLFMDALLISHYIGSIFLRIDIGLWNTQFYGDNTSLYWLSNNADFSDNLMGGAWYLQYIYAQEYSTGTLSTLAPGPFPKNPLEVLYAIFIMVFLIILSAFLAENVVAIFYWEAELRVTHETNILSFIRFLEVKRVDKIIKRQTQNYFELIWESQKKVDKQSEESALQKLSVKLRNQLISQVMGLRYLRFITYFKQHEIQLQEELIPFIHTRMTDANQVLFSPQAHDLVNHQHQMFIISSGNVKFTITLPNGEEKILGLTNTQKVLGVYELLTDESYFFEVRTLYTTHFHYMCRDDFLSVIQKLDLREMFCQLLYNIQIERRLHLIGKYCSICIGEHLERDCPSIMYSRKIQFLLKYHQPYIYDYEQLRGRYKRKDRRNQLAFKDKKPEQIDENNPLSFLNSILLNRYFRKLMIDSEDMEQAHPFEQYYPKYNITNLIT